MPTDLKLKKLGEHVIAVLIEIMNGNSENARVFRDSEGTELILQLIHFPPIRKQSLVLLQHLILSGGNEEDMKALLSLLYVTSHHTSTQPNVDHAVASNHKTDEMTEDYESRIEVINAIIFCLRESHKSRTIFRKVGGFVYIVSAVSYTHLTLPTICSV